MKKNKRNAVLYKEMTVDIKKPKAMLIILLVNLLLLPIPIVFLGAASIFGFVASISYRIMVWYYLTLIVLEILVITFLTPAITAGCISLEKERQTLDVLLTTQMTPWEIVKGKYFSETILIGLIILSTFPIMALVFIYGGISILGVLLVLLELLIFAGFVASIGVFCSALTKNTVLSVILSYVIIFVYIQGTIILPLSVVLGIEMVNSLIYDKFYAIQTEHLLFSDIFSLLGVLNPYSIFVDTLGKTIGFSNDWGIFGSVPFYGLNTLLGAVLPHFTENNILLKLWSLWGVLVEVAISFGLLKLSGVLLNPVKKRNRRKNKKQIATRKNNVKQSTVPKATEPAENANVQNETSVNNVSNDVSVNVDSNSYDY